MNLNTIILSVVKEFIVEQTVLTESWFHGTPDGREVEKAGGFDGRTISVDYVQDIKKI